MDQPVAEIVGTSWTWLALRRDTAGRGLGIRLIETRMRGEVSLVQDIAEAEEKTEEETNDDRGRDRDTRGLGRAPRGALSTYMGASPPKPGLKTRNNAVVEAR